MKPAGGGRREHIRTGLAESESQREDEMSTKAANTGQLPALKRMRGDRTMERRALVLQYREAADPIEVVEKIVTCQAQIDAIDQAIVDEKRLTRSRDKQ
jgi:hypothetical protein